MVAKVSARTRGGHRLRAFLRAVQSGAVRRRYLEIAEDALRREMLPELADRTPKVSGTLAESYNIRPSRGGGLALTSTAPYVNEVRFRKENLGLTRGAPDVRELAHQVVREKLPGISARAARRAIREAS